MKNARLLIAAGALLAACSSDAPEPPDQEPPGGGEPASDAGAGFQPPRADGGAADAEYALELVADLNTESESSGAFRFVGHEGRVFFGARRGAGYALYAVDDGGTTPVVIAERASWRAAPQPEISYAGKVLFSVQDEIVGTELWATDGSDGGTVLLADVNPGAGGGAARVLGQTTGGAVFAATTLDGPALWVTKGTPESTQQISSVGVGTVFGGGSSAVALGGRLLFSSAGGAEGAELWITNGTSAGTKLVRDINPGPASSSPAGFVALEDKVFFAASDGTSGIEPWITDGTEAGTQLIRDVNAGSASAISAIGLMPVVHQGFVYFPANDGSLGTELWRTDGTAANTTLVKDLNPGAASGSPAHLASLGARLVFSAEAPGLGRELHASDGTTAGTALVRDIAPGASSASIQRIEVFEGNGYFQANDGQHGGELWRTDGTAAGTRMVIDLVPGSGSGLAGSPTVAGGAIYINGGPQGFPHRSDGSAEGTRPLGPLDFAMTASSEPSAFVTAGDRVFFTATDPEHGRELWVMDTAGVRRVRDIHPGARDGASGAPYAVGDRVFFIGITAEHGAELWTSDGTEAGTRLVKDVRPGPETGTFGPLEVFEGRLYFFANDGSEVGMELWSTDGTESGTRLVADVDPTPNNGGVGTRELGVYDGRLMWNARDTNYGLFTLAPDGGVARVGPPGLMAGPIVAVGGAIYFSAGRPIGAPGSDPQGLYRTDGTAAGTSLVSRHVPCALIGMDGLAIFTVGTTIWRSDGTPAGTSLLSSVGPGCNAKGLFPYKGSVYFVGGNGTDGVGLWRTGLTPNSAELVAPMGATGAESITGFDDRMFFAGSTGPHGQELWTSDGTSGGTRMVLDAHPGPVGSRPANLSVAGDLLLMKLNDGVHGAEPWVLRRR